MGYNGGGDRVYDTFDQSSEARQDRPGVIGYIIRCESWRGYWVI